MSEQPSREEFAAGMRYEEVSKKCFCCGRVIPHEPLVRETQGQDRTYCSQDCVDVYQKYRLPYVDAN